jgi:uncharacterized protein (DUF924 family)
MDPRAGKQSDILAPLRYAHAVGSPRAAALLAEWFGVLDADGLAPKDKQQRWWLKDPQFDQFLKDTYEHDVQAALIGDLDSWLEETETALPLIVLLDQVTRNIYRDTPEMYFGDARALRAVDRLIAAGSDEALPTHYRAFVYMPLMHAESMNRQQQSLAQFKKLTETGSDVARAAMKGAYEYAQKHAEIIQRFGRFPHRNWILERTSTAEEIEFMTEPGSSF